MSKQSDPWDDSALLNAFDDAITKYKFQKMHKKERCDDPKEGENVVVISSSEALSTATPDDVSPEQFSETITSLKDTGNADDPSFIEENHQTDLHSQEPTKNTSDNAHMQEVPEGHTNSQGVDEHNDLLKQYYELEEQRQKIIQQLQQSGYWNYKYSGEVSGSSGQWGTCLVQDYQHFNQQAPHPAVVSCCCPCVCPMDPCSAMPGSSLCGTSISRKDFESTSIACTKVPENLSTFEDDTIVKTAMGAAERAISSINLNASSAHTKHEGSLEGQIGEHIIPETDITVVLNAWYSAGFYTGKYLTEQSILKSKRG